jgi:hypothetical protein
VVRDDGLSAISSTPMDWLTFDQRKGENNQAWSIFIDVEGFSSLQNVQSTSEVSRGLNGLRLLTTELFKIGANAYPGKTFNAAAERLFMHQFGDGYLIWPCCWEDQVERPLLICIAIMRSLILSKVATKAAISYGSLSDQLFVYAHDIKEKPGFKHGRASIGNGLMTFTPALGTALINPYKLSNKLKGAQLIVDYNAIAPPLLPAWLSHRTPRESDGSWGVVDWVHGTSEQLEFLCEAAQIACPSPSETERALREYMELEPRPKCAWRDATLIHTNSTQLN